MPDRANLHEGLRQASQALARRYRNLSQYYQEYLAVKEARLAARINYEVQWENYVTNRTIYLNVLQAITSWGNAVSAEAQSLLQYNSELAALDQETGLILELHGIRFYEEGFRSKGPAGRLGPERCYPRRSCRARTPIVTRSAISPPKTSSTWVSWPPPVANRRANLKRRLRVELVAHIVGPWPADLRSLSK